MGRLVVIAVSESKKPDRSGHVEEHPTEAEIDDTLEQTFPASDPPSWTLGLERHRARHISVDPTQDETHEG